MEEGTSEELGAALKFEVPRPGPRLEARLNHKVEAKSSQVFQGLNLA